MVWPPCMTRLKGRLHHRFFVGVLAMMLLATVNAQETGKKPLNGLCYGPFRAGEQPGGSYPTESELTQDLGVVASLALKIRTYGNENSLALIPQACARAGVACYAGAWIDSDKTSNEQQLAGLVAIATNHYPTTQGFIVGNEYLLRNEQTAFATAKTNLLQYVQRIKASTGGNVGVADGWNIWNNDFTRDLVNELDFVLVHIHPFWESQYSTPHLTIDTALAHVTNKYNLIVSKYPGKRIIIGETGWPSRGPQKYGAVASEGNQARFVREFTEWARQNKVEYFLFEGFDEPWKGTTTAEGGFGVLTSARPFTPKPSLSNLLSSRMVLTLQNTADSLHLTTGTYEGNRYVLEQRPLPLPGTWQTVTSFTGATGAPSTSLLLPAASQPVSFYRIKAEF